MVERTLDVPPGHLAEVATYLEIVSPDAFAPPGPPRGGWEMRRIERPTLEEYRALFRAVGERWLWCSRLMWSDAKVLSLIRDPGIEVYALAQGGARMGMLELDFREPGEVEIALLGVVDALIGTGAGTFLMSFALERAWAAKPRRVWLHTCQYDSPQAMGFYRRCGFVAYRQQIEIYPDPRLIGALPRTAAPHVPLAGGTPVLG